MTPADLHSVIYVLMAEEAGGRDALEEQLKTWNDEEEKLKYMNSPARFDPKVPLPESAAAGLREVMQLGGPAPRKDAS